MTGRKACVGMRAKAKRGSTVRSDSVGAESSLTSEQLYQLKALRAHYEDFYRTLHRQAFKIVGSKEAADDVVQDAFTNTAQTIVRGSVIDNLAGWLNRCVQNSSLHYVDHLNQKVHPLLEDFDLVDPGSSLDLAHAKVQYGAEVFEAVNGLTPPQKSAFLLAELKGLKHCEIADIMDCSENSIAQLLMRARKHIQEAIGPDTLSFAAPSIALQLYQQDSNSHLDRVGGFWDRFSAKLTQLHDSFTSFTSLTLRSSEAIAQHAAALMTGTAVVVALSSPIVGSDTALTTHSSVRPSAITPIAHKENKARRNNKQRATDSDNSDGISEQSASTESQRDLPRPNQKRKGISLDPPANKSEDRTSPLQSFELTEVPMSPGQESGELGQPPPQGSPQSLSSEADRKMYGSNYSSAEEDMPTSFPHMESNHETRLPVLDTPNTESESGQRKSGNGTRQPNQHLPSR